MNQLTLPFRFNSKIINTHELIGFIFPLIFMHYLILLSLSCQHFFSK